MMKNPPHPGRLLKENFGPEGLNISVAEAARNLGISRVSLSRVVNGRAAISADLALRLETAGLSSAHFWLSMQSAYDLNQAEMRKQPRVTPFVFPKFPKAA